MGLSGVWIEALRCTCDESVRALYPANNRHSAVCELACLATPPWSTFGRTTCRLARGHAGVHDTCAGEMWSDKPNQCSSISPGHINRECRREHGHVGGHFDGVGTRW